jgi:hypothetical protein
VNAVSDAYADEVRRKWSERLPFLRDIQSRP